jgi:hypothetical protein
MSPEVPANNLPSLPLFQFGSPQDLSVILGPLPWDLLARLPQPVTRVGWGGAGGPSAKVHPRLAAIPASLPPLALAVAARLLELAPRHVYTTLELLPTEYRDLLFLLPPETQIHAADLDLSDPARCGQKLRGLFPREWAGPTKLTLEEARGLLAEQEQGLHPSGPFWRWVGGLEGRAWQLAGGQDHGQEAAGTEGSGPKAGGPKDEEPTCQEERCQQHRPQASGPDPADLQEGAALPLLVLGRGLLLTDLHEFLEAGGFFVAHDEEPAAELLACLSGPEEFARRLFWTNRLDAALEAGLRAGARGAVFVHEAFSGRGVEEALYRSRVNLPFLSLPVEELGPLDGRLRLRVAAFLELLAAREVGR